MQPEPAVSLSPALGPTEACASAARCMFTEPQADSKDNADAVQANEIASRMTRQPVKGDAVLSLPADTAWLAALSADRAYTAQQLMYFERSWSLKHQRAAQHAAVGGKGAVASCAAPRMCVFACLGSAHRRFKGSAKVAAGGTAEAAISKRASSFDAERAAPRLQRFAAARAPSPISRSRDNSSREEQSCLRSHPIGASIRPASPVVRASAPVAAPRAASPLGGAVQAAPPMQPGRQATVAPERPLPDPSASTGVKVSQLTRSATDSGSNGSFGGGSADCDSTSATLTATSNSPRTGTSAAEAASVPTLQPRLHSSAAQHHTNSAAPRACADTRAPAQRAAPQWAAAPTDVLAAVLRKLPCCDLVAASGACRAWRQAALQVRLFSKLVPAAHVRRCCSELDFRDRCVKLGRAVRCCSITAHPCPFANPCGGYHRAQH
jgi:F-box domain